MLRVWCRINMLVRTIVYSDVIASSMGMASGGTRSSGGIGNKIQAYTCGSQSIGANAASSRVLLKESHLHKNCEILVNTSDAGTNRALTVTFPLLNNSLTDILHWNLLQIP